MFQTFIFFIIITLRYLFIYLFYSKTDCWYSKCLELLKLTRRDLATFSITLHIACKVSLYRLDYSIVRSVLTRIDSSPHFPLPASYIVKRVPKCEVSFCMRTYNSNSCQLAICYHCFLFIHQEMVCFALLPVSSVLCSDRRLDFALHDKTW